MEAQKEQDKLKGRRKLKAEDNLEDEKPSFFARIFRVPAMCRKKLTEDDITMAAFTDKMNKREKAEIKGKEVERTGPTKRNEDNEWKQVAAKSKAKLRESVKVPSLKKIGSNILATGDIIHDMTNKPVCVSTICHMFYPANPIR